MDSEDYSEPEEEEGDDEVQDGIEMQADNEENATNSQVLRQPIADVAVFGSIPDSADLVSEA